MHAQGIDDFGIAPAHFDQHRSAGADLRRLHRGRFGHAVGGQHDGDQHDNADRREHAQRPVEHEQDGQIEKDPRQIEQGQRPRPRNIGADRVQIARGLRAFGHFAPPQFHLGNDVEDARRDFPVDQCADLDHRPGSQQVQHPLKAIDNSDNDQQADKRGDATTRQYLVIDQQHEKGAAQHQNVQHRADYADLSYGEAESTERRTDFRFRIKYLQHQFVLHQAASRPVRLGVL